MDPATRIALLRWYDAHKRDLPWRRSRDPYAIWVSEIMLQQTRVAAVLEHYARWMVRFPTVEALARAEEPEVLALWSGLGYYRRARMLHRAARVVGAEHGGHLPETAEALRRLPGIGEYTSAAIASIAFGEPVAVVDGNVERVVNRLQGLALEPYAEQGAAAVEPGLDAKAVPPNGSPARAIRAGAQALLDTKRPGDSNQAMMELGATVCLPKAPLCLSCPIEPWCRTRGEHPTAPKMKQQRKEIAFALVRSGDGERVLLQRRPAGVSLMAGMWELPELAGEPNEAPALLRLKHSITVTNYAVRIVETTESEVARSREAALPAESTAEPPVWIALAELPEMPLTGLCRKALKRLALWPERALSGAG